MNTKILIKSVFLSSIFLAACSKGPADNPLPPSPTQEPSSITGEKLEIKISPNFTTRATDYGFETNDRIGLFVVNYNGSTPGVLADRGNHVDNMGFTYSGVWTPDIPIFWKDESTHADLYLYYPYSQTASVTAYPFSVKTDQSTESAYKASDMMVGKATNIAPSSEATLIPANHVMSRINIQLAAGNGFTDETLAKSNISVKINGVKTSSTVNLSSGIVTPSGDPVSITPWLNKGIYQALIIPQIVPYGNLISVIIDNREFTLKKGFSFESNKSHKFTVTLSKTSNGINVNINPWDEDGIDNGGVAE